VKDQNDVIDLNDDDLAQTPEQQAGHEAKYLEEVKARILQRTHSFLSAPKGEDLYWLLNSLARYMSAKGVKVTSDKAVLLTWHTATCGECQVDEDGSMESPCCRYDEYLHGAAMDEPELPRRAGMRAPIETTIQIDRRNMSTSSTQNINCPLCNAPGATTLTDCTTMEMFVYCDACHRYGVNIEHPESAPDPLDISDAKFDQSHIKDCGDAK